MSENQICPLLDGDSPLGLPGLLGDDFHTLLGSLRTAVTDYPDAIGLMADEDAMLEYLSRSFRFRPTKSENRIRLLFWQEYEASIAEGRKMSAARVYGLTCSRDFFISHFGKKERALFLLTKPAGYVEQVQEMLHAGLASMRRVLDIDPLAGGKVNTKLLELQLKITAMMDIRVNGNPITKQLNLNVYKPMTNSEAKELSGTMVATDMAAIQRRLEEIERQKLSLEKQEPDRIERGKAIEVEVVRSERHDSDA